MINKKENNLDKIVLKYDDGTEKEISKGVVITLNSVDEDESTLNFEFAHMKGNELTDIILGVMQMGVEIGIFNE